MLKKVLLKKSSKGQSIAASIGIFTGLFLLLFAFQVYSDVQILSKGARDNNFLVINKQFERHLGKPKNFSAEEIKEIKEQPFFKRVATFTSNNFQVLLSSRQMGFQTLLFFQAVPNEFLGIDTSKFTWKPGEKVPIVLSKDYLALYNYGLAPSQGMPQFSASTIGFVEFDVLINNSKKSNRLKASILGFTPNINSILVPQSFLDYYNKEYGSQQKVDITQIMASTDNPYSLALENFLEKNGYEISKGGLIGGELKSTLYLLVLLLIAIGFIIVGLALLVFLLNFQVLVAQASQDIKLLLQLGYQDGQITKVLADNLLKLFGWILLAVFLVLSTVKYLIAQSILELGYQLPSYLDYKVWILGLFFALVFVRVNLSSIRKNVRKLA